MIDMISLESMTRTILRRAAVLLFLASLLSAQPAGRQKRTVIGGEVTRVHKSALLIDTHNDAALLGIEGDTGSRTASACCATTSIWACGT